MNKIAEAYRINARMYNLALAYIASALILRFPWLVTGWVPESQQGIVFSLADNTATFILGVLIFWVKDKTVSGNGSADKPFEKKQA